MLVTTAYFIEFKIRPTNVPVARSAPTSVQIRHTSSENGSQIVQHHGIESFSHKTF